MPSFKIDIQAPPDEVFDYLCDVTRHTEWANPKADMKARQTSGAGPGPDATYRTEGVFVNKPVSADITVTAYDRPSRFSIRSDQHQEGKKDVWYENDYSLHSTGGGTQLVKRVTSNGNPVIFVVAYPAIRGDAMTSLRNLKAKLETGV
jgi:uncharacterized protein YndB with AHSA1/START domain